MDYDLEVLTELSGDKATIYSLLPRGKEYTLFDDFVDQNRDDFSDEIRNIVNTLKLIGEKHGVREQFGLFKIHEGKPGDGLVALFDNPNKKLRLYAIRFCQTILILGGGGLKTTRTLQEDPKLHLAQAILVNLSKTIDRKIREKEWIFDDATNQLIGDLFVVL